MAAASIVIDLLMRTGSFETDTKRAEKALQNLANKAKAIGTTVGLAFTAAAAATALFVKAAIDTADASIKAAQAAGLSVESFTALAFAAGLSGTSSEQLGTALAKLSRNAVEALGGNKQLAASFDAIGVSVTNADGSLKATDVLLGEIADRFAGYADGAEKTALAQELFGKSGAALIPLLNAGSAGIEELKDEALALGVVIGTDTAKAAEQFNDNLSRLSSGADGLALKLAQRALPALNDITDIFVDLAKSSDEVGSGVSILGAVFDGAVEIFKVVAILAANVGFVLKVIGLEAGGAAARVGLLFNLLAQGPRAFVRGFSSLKGQINFISEAVAADTARARTELDDFEKRLLTAGGVKPTGSAPPPPAFRPPAPRSADSAAATKAAEDAEKARAKLAEDAAKARAKALDEAANDAQRAVDARTKSIEQARAFIQSQIDAVEQQIAEFGTDGTSQIVFELVARGADPEDIKRLSEATAELTRLRGEREKGVKAGEDAKLVEAELADLYEKTRTPVERLAIELERLDKLRNAPGASQDVIDRAYFEALERFSETLDGVNEQLPKTKSLAEEIGLSFASAFEDAVLQGSELTDVLKSLAQDLARLALRRLVTEPLLNALSAALPGRADGGPVLAGTTYLIGERGPELFTPTASGSIASNQKLSRAMDGSGSSGNVIIQNYGADVTARRESNGDTAVIVRTAADIAYNRVVADLASGSGRASGALRARGVGMDSALPRRQ